jgi:hypothetical protein
MEYALSVSPPVREAQRQFGAGLGVHRRASARRRRGDLRGVPLTHKEETADSPEGTRGYTHSVGTRPNYVADAPDRAMARGRGRTAKGGALNPTRSAIHLPDAWQFIQNPSVW